MHECVEQNLWNFDGLKYFKIYIDIHIGYIYTNYVQSCSESFSKNNKFI